MELSLAAIHRSLFFLILVLVVVGLRPFAQADEEPPTEVSAQDQIIQTVESRSTMSQEDFTGRMLPLLETVQQEMQAGKIPADSWKLDTPQFFSAIDELVQFEPKSRAIVIATFESRLMQALEEKQSQHLGDYYRLVVQSRPDPDEANTQLRKRIVLEARGPEAKIFALGRLEELRFAKALTFLDQVRVVLHGYYGKNFLYLGAALVFLALVAAGVALIRPFLWMLVAKQIAKQEEQAKVEAEINSKIMQTRAASTSSTEQPTQRLKRPILSTNKNVSGYARGPVEEDEYSRLLGVLGLDDTANESDIKKAYREMVKSLHPDSGGTTQETEGFIELKEVYDRILEIRGSWFGGKR